MSSTTPSCLRCRVAMEDGYLLDRAHHNSTNQAEWVDGVPELRQWLGMSLGLKTANHTMLKVVAYRCPRCGMLESYAHHKSNPS